MFPELFHLGPVTIRTYGFLIAVGLFLGLQYVLRGAKAKAIPEDRILDAALYVIVAGLIGARLTYVVLNWSFYLQHPFEIVQVWEGGLVFYGGFVASAAAVIMYTRRHRDTLRLGQLADLMAPALCIGHFFGRLGCFCAGCCYGMPSDLPWAVRFVNPKALAPTGILLHPAQLYEAFANMALFFVLDRYRVRGGPKDGQVFALYLMLYAALRFVIELFRGDDRGGFLWGLSPSQLVAAVLFITGIALFRWLASSLRQAQQPS